MNRQTQLLCSIVRENDVTDIVAQFEIGLTRILNHQGELIATPPAIANNSDAMRALYRIMVLTRTFDKKAIALQRTGQMGTYAPIYTQEAISTAIGYVMQKEDIFIPYYRDYAALYQRGVKFSEILAFWGGDERGSDYQNNSQDMPICVPIASQCLHAGGIAFSFKYRQQNRVALACIGDGGTSEGDFYEAINVAGCWRLPLVIVINNNQWAISVPVEKQTACQTLAQKAIAAGIPGVQVDGNDLLGLLDVTEKALHHARSGQGPMIIEALTYRLTDHTTADDATRYQPSEKVEAAKPNEPLIRFKKYLQKYHSWTNVEQEQLLAECADLIQKEIDDYLNRPKQLVSSMFDFHYETLPEYLMLQRAIAMEEASNA
jgi:2-oxoisovalerate dehydrogenase E1 component alpha subunit